MADKDLQLEYGVRFDVKTGGDNATAEIKALSDSWQKLLDKQKLVIKMGAEAEKYSMGNTTEAKAQSTAAENDRNKQARQLKELSAYYKELSDRARDFYNANQSDKSAALDGMKKRLEQIKKEQLDILKINTSSPLMLEQEKGLNTKTAWIAQLNKEAAGIKAAMDALNSIQMGGAPANVQKLNSELTTTNFTLLQMREYYKQVAAENAKLVKDATSKTNTKDVLGMKEGSIDEVQKKIQRLEQSMRLLSDTANKVGLNDAKLNNAFRTANDEVNRLQQKLATMQGSFGNRSLNSLLQINPKSIQETNALMAELARRRDALNRTDPGYANSISAINKRQAELSAENARALGISQQKEKAINAETAAFAKQSTVISNLRNMAATYLSLYEGARLIGNIAKITGEFELQEKSLGAIIQSAEKAHELFGQIKALAVISPFTFKDLLSYTKQLAAYRVETDQLYETTKKLADVSAGLGVDMNRIILAYGQVQAASVLRGQELRQFTEAGIPLVSLLADKFTELEGRVVSTGEVFTKIGERLVPFEMIKGIFADMTNEGGMFFNMQEIQADTLAGKISNLKDSYQIMFASIGESGLVNDILKGTIDLVTKLARNWENVASVMVPLVAGLGAYKAGLLLISGVEAAKAGIYAANIAAQTTLIGLNDKEAASIARKTAFQEASLLASKANITANTIMSVAASKNIAFDKQEIVSKMIKTAVIKAGSDATKLANLQTEISNILTSQGVAKDRAAAMSRLALANATNTATASTMTFGTTFKAVFASIPVFGWILLAVSAVVALVAAITNANAKANALNKEIARIGVGGQDESGRLVGKFIQLSETARDTTKTLKEQNDALNTLKQVYGDILPDYMLTIEGLTAIGDKYNDVTAAIYANIAAKTKEKQINAVTENYTEKINPIIDRIKTDLQDLGIESVLANKAIAELQKRINEGNVAKPFWELLKILEEINGTEINPEGRYVNKNLNELKDGTKELNSALMQQKKTIEELTNTDYSFFGKFDVQAKKLDVEIKKATDNVIKGQKQVAGKITYFDESIYQFNERKADAQRVKLIDFINKVKSDAANAIQNNDNALALGMTNWIEGATKKLANLNVNPIAENVNKLLERVSESQGVGSSQYNSLAYKSDNKEDYLKDLEQRYKSVKEKIEQANKANKDFASGVKAAVAVKGDVELTKEEYLNGYIAIDGVRQKGLKQELEAINTIRAAYGLVDKEKKERSVVNPRIAAIENEIALIEQAKKKYEELLKAGKSPEQSKTIVDDLYKDQFNLKDEKGKVLFQPVFDEKGWIEALKVGKEELKKIPKTEQPVFKVNLKINESEIKIFTDETKAVLDKIEKDFNTSKKRIDLFKNIFDATGDSSLSKKIAESIEGVGTTDIETALNEAFRKSFEAIDVKPMFDKLGNVDIAASQAEINKLDPKSDSRVQAQKQLDVLKEFKAKEYVELLKGLKDYETFEARKTAISRDAAKERFKIENDINLSEEEKLKYTQASTKKENEAKARINVEQFKDSPLWAETFSDLDKISTESLELLKTKLKELIENVKGTSEPTQLKELMKSLEDIENRTANLDFGKLFKVIFENIDLTPLKNAVDEADIEVKRLKLLKDKAVEDEGAAINNSTKVLKKVGGDVANTEYIKAKEEEGVATKKVTDLTTQLTSATEKATVAEKEYTDAADKKRKALENAGKSIEKEITELNKIKAAYDEIVDAVYNIADAFGVTFNEETKGIIEAFSKGFGAAVSILSAVLALIIAINAVMAVNPIFLAIALIIGALVTVMALIKNMKLSPINDQLKEQESIVKSLEEQYAKLERSMERVLGTEWIEAYNNELTNLSQQVASLSEQIRLEKSKGKDADQTKIDELNKQVDETSNKIEDAGKKLQNFVVGTDLTSAATDFANSWLDAYKSFGSTTEAMKTKFKDMISSMVVNTLLAKAMEIALKPIFTAMEKAAETTSESGSAYSYAEIANIIAETTKSTANADANLKKIMDGLKSAGVDIRDGSSNLTGLSKGISSVTEDTALLLGGYLDSIRFRLFAYFDAMDAANKFDLAGSMAQLMVAQNSQITHLEGIKANTLRTAVACEVLTGEIQSVKALSTNGSGYALKVNI